MKLIIYIVIYCVFLLPGLVVSKDISREEGASFVPYQAIVKFKNYSTPSRVLGLRTARSLGRNTFVVSTDQRSGKTHGDVQDEAGTWELIEALRKRADVEFAHPDYFIEFSQSPPNDPLLPAQWNLDAINIPDAWSISTGSAAIRIAVIDGGRSAHPEFNGKWAGAYNAANPGGALDEFSSWPHSTHVASIASGRSNNGVGIAGVCQDCRLLSIKVVDTSGEITLGYIIAGIDWAIANQADVVNISLSFDKTPCSGVQGLQDAISAATSADIPVVVAAGNFSGQVSSASPASCNGVIAVGATDRNNSLASYSNRGAGMLIVAPGGGGILNNPPVFGDSAFGEAVGCPLDPESDFGANQFGVLAAWTTIPPGGVTHCFRYLSGTSMAAPHVAGVIGLMLSVNASMSLQLIKEALSATARPVNNCATECGAGLLDADAALAIAQNPDLLNSVHMEPVVSYLLD